MQGSGERRRGIANLYVNGSMLRNACPVLGIVRKTAALASELRLRLMIDA